jgi:hypothetical protein
VALFARRPTLDPKRIWPSDRGDDSGNITRKRYRSFLKANFASTRAESRLRLPLLAGPVSISRKGDLPYVATGGVSMAHRLRFGIFLAPFHKPGINPTLALQSDLELIQWLDRCGYDEAWCGEHHSAGTRSALRPKSSWP